MTSKAIRQMPRPTLSKHHSDYVAECEYNTELKAVRALDYREITIALEHCLECPSLQSIISEGSGEFLTRHTARKPEPEQAHG